MESTHRPGNLTCIDARELLSDLIDARRGEMPHPDGSFLCEAGLRPALELHLVACESCRLDLQELEQVGQVFASFSVNELSAQTFSDYGQKVRLRMKQGTHTSNVTVLGHLSRKNKFWLAGLVSASTAVAAVWVMVATIGTSPLPSNSKPDIATSLTLADKEKPKQNTEPRRANTHINYEFPTPAGLQRASLRASYDPSEMEQVQKNEGLNGYLLFPEPLLGVRLKTTRELDRVADEGPGGLIVDCVVQGSPAWQMGLRKNDYIVTLNGEGIKEGGALEAIKFLADVRALGAGTAVKLHIVRPANSQYLFLRPAEGILGQYEFAP